MTQRTPSPTQTTIATRQPQDPATMAEKGRRSVEAKRARDERAAAMLALAIDDIAETVAKTYLADLATRRIQPSAAINGLVDLCHRIVRLERGQATSRSEHLDLSGELADLIPSLRLSASRPGVEVVATARVTSEAHGVAAVDADDQASTYT